MWKGLGNEMGWLGTTKGAQMCRRAQRPPRKRVISGPSCRAWATRERGFRKVGSWVPPKATALSNFPEVLANKGWIQGSEIFLPVLKVSSLCPSKAC